MQFQIAVEVSKLESCSYKIAFDSSRNSPGFNRKMHCESTRYDNNAIDEELRLAQEESREPDTKKWSGPMFLKEDGKSFWEAITQKSPLLIQQV